MYQKVSFCGFVDAFHRMNRYAQFSAYYQDGKPIGAYEGLRVLFDWIEDVMTPDDHYELDVIGLCCEFAHDTASEIAEQYGMAGINTRDMTEDECKDAIRQYLEDEGALIGETDYGFVYRQH